MAGIGFSLRKMLKDESTYSTRVYAWFHTAIVSAGPWIISILTINIVLAFSKRWNLPYAERELLIASIIYSTLFSQLLTAPFQMIITRYIADRIYKEEFEYIKPSFWGVSILMAIISLFVGIWYYHDKELPLEYLYLVVALMVVLSVLWVLMVYQSTLKNFRLITMSNLLGTFVTFMLILFLANNPLEFQEHGGATNLLLAYLGGIVFFTIFLLIAFLTELKEDNGKIFHFIRYFHSVPSLWPIGLFYTFSIWVDNLIMWFSPISVNLYGIYRYAPFYDVATFYSYLTILPSIMLFMVLIETDFYVKCREFYLAVLRNGPLSELQVFADRMWKSLQKNILQTFEIQLFITILIIVLSRSVFPILGVPEESRQIFIIYALGAFCNAFILIFLQVLLYIGERNRTLVLMIIFFCTNVVFTLLSLQWGEGYYGLGFFISSFTTMLIGLYLTVISYRRVIRHTYMTQPVYERSTDKPFEKLEVWLDNRLTDKDALDKIYLEKRRDKQKRRRPADVRQHAEVSGDTIDVGVQEQKAREAEKDYQLLAELFSKTQPETGEGSAARADSEELEENGAKIDVHEAPESLKDTSEEESAVGTEQQMELDGESPEIETFTGTVDESFDRDDSELYEDGTTEDDLLKRVLDEYLRRSDTAEEKKKSNNWEEEKLIPDDKGDGDKSIDYDDIP